MRKRNKPPALASLKIIEKEIKHYHRIGRIALVDLVWKLPAGCSFNIRGWAQWSCLNQFMLIQIKKGNKLISWSIYTTNKVIHHYPTSKRKRRKRNETSKRPKQANL